MNKQQLFETIQQRKSFLCVGLDSDIRKLPQHLIEREEDPVFAFNKAIIDATADLCVAYKPNLAFYECNGLKGWQSYERTISYLRQRCPNHLIIADAKRGDIGNTSQMYARSFFEEMDVDSVTVAPYMGQDSVTPFLGFEGKWVILLALTSNKGAQDFQYISDSEGRPLFRNVLEHSLEWGGTPDNMMYVVGATRAEMLTQIRSIVPDSFLLVPGIGAQGGSLADVCRYGMNSMCGLIVNSSRAIIYADSTRNFAAAAAEQAKAVQQEMSSYLK